MISEAINKMTQKISDILAEREPSIYLYGSVILDDYRDGWSDIDILVLTKTTLSEREAEELLYLRQRMTEAENNPVYRSFEGGILSLSAFVEKQNDRVVYWGTSGERVCESYAFDAFSTLQLIENGVLLYGENVKEYLQKPTHDELYANVKHHCETIRKYAVKTTRSLYSFGWLLDIARCIYTLRTGKIMAKTEAGKWALSNGLCPSVESMKLAISVREDPVKYKNDPDVMDAAENLGKDVQRFADVLERELAQNKLLF